MKLFYVNLITGASSESFSQMCPIPVAGVKVSETDCMLQGCHFLITTPAALLQTLNTSAGKLCMQKAAVAIYPKS